MTAFILLALAVVMFCAVLGRGTVAVVARGVAVLAFVGLLVAVLTGCAPPPPAGTATLDGASLREAVSPPWLWRGADHPEWASCRYEPPAALCTEMGRGEVEP